MELEACVFGVLCLLTVCAPKNFEASASNNMVDDIADPSIMKFLCPKNLNADLVIFRIKVSQKLHVSISLKHGGKSGGTLAI